MMKEIFEGALAVLDERGWTRGAPTSPGGPVCLGIALTLACKAGSVSTHSQDYVRAQRFLLTANDLTLLNVVGWNDAPGRTYEDVVLVLKQAIYACDEES